MPDTIREQAGDALSRAGQRLAEAETGVRDAIAGLNQAIDAAHVAGIGPRYARAMVNAGGHLGALGRAYLNREIRSWNDIYENGARPVNQNDSELLDLHARPRPKAPAFSHGWASSVPGALARAGQELVRVETGYDTAYARFSDASDFAQHARVPADQAASLVTTISGPLGDISSELVAAEVDDWDASITLDLASDLADGTEPPGFWAAVADARAEKGAGYYGAAAASWTLARDQLPSGHLMRDGLDSLISALHSASGTGQHVTRHGYIVHHSTEPPSPWSVGQLVEAVRNHAAGLGDDKQALRKVLDGWTDGAIAAAFDAARDPGEAVARACLFATFERAEQLRTQPLQDAAVAGEPIVTQVEASASAGPCTVTGYFATNVGPTLHYTLASAAGDVLDYSRDPDGNITAQVQAGNRWIDLAGQDPRYQAVIRGVQEHEARNPDLAGYNNPQAASAERHGDTPGGITRVPATIAFSQLRDFERTAPDGTPATVKFRRGQQLQPGDVISGQRDPWAVVTHITWSGPEVAIRVQEAGGSRTMTSGTRGPSLDVRADLRVDPSTCPDIPDGFPPRWGAWRSGPGQSRESTDWFPEPGQAAQHARQASQDGNEYVVELESPDGCWTQVDAYQQGRRSAWGTQLAAGQAKTVTPPWATPGPVPAARPGARPARRPAQHRRQPGGPALGRTP